MFTEAHTRATWSNNYNYMYRLVLIVAYGWRSLRWKTIKQPPPRRRRRRCQQHHAKDQKHSFFSFWVNGFSLCCCLLLPLLPVTKWITKLCCPWLLRYHHHHHWIGLLPLTVALGRNTLQPRWSTRHPCITSWERLKWCHISVYHQPHISHPPQSLLEFPLGSSPRWLVFLAPTPPGPWLKLQPSRWPVITPLQPNHRTSDSWLVQQFIQRLNPIFIHCLSCVCGLSHHFQCQQQQLLLVLYPSLFFAATETITLPSPSWTCPSTSSLA